MHLRSITTHYNSSLAEELPVQTGAYKGVPLVQVAAEEPWNPSFLRDIGLPHGRLCGAGRCFYGSQACGTAGASFL